MPIFFILSSETISVIYIAFSYFKSENSQWSVLFKHGVFSLSVKTTLLLLSALFEKANQMIVLRS